MSRAPFAVLLVGVLLFALPGRSSQPDARAATIAAAAAALDDTEARFTAGAASAEDVYRWSKRWMEAARSVDPAAPKVHAARMERLSVAVAERVAAGVAPAGEAKAAAFYVAEAALLAK